MIINTFCFGAKYGKLLLLYPLEIHYFPFGGSELPKIGPMRSTKLGGQFFRENVSLFGSRALACSERRDRKYGQNSDSRRR
jgi:hypothetical protein